MSSPSPSLSLSCQEVHVSERGSAETALDKGERERKKKKSLQPVLTERRRFNLDLTSTSSRRFSAAAAPLKPTAQTSQLLSLPYFHFSRHMYIRSSSTCVWLFVCFFSDAVSFFFFIPLPCVKSEACVIKREQRPARGALIPRSLVVTSAPLPH